MVFGLVTLCAFVSGFALHWRTYANPTETEVVRGYGAPLRSAELADIRVPAADAMLRWLNERFVWVIGSRLIDAQSGDTMAGVSEADAIRIAGRVVLTPYPPLRSGERELGEGPTTELVRSYDHFYWLGKPPLPAYRVTFRSPRRVDVYVSQATGTVTAVIGWRAKLTDLLGEKVHFLKVGALRTITTPRFVIMGALATVILTGAISGLVYGVPLLFRRLSGVQRWASRLRSFHNIAGALVGLVIVMWGTTSYLMLWYPSMDPAPDEVTRVNGGVARAAVYRVSPGAAVAAVPRPVFALRTARLLDRPVYVAIHEDGAATLIDGQSGSVISPVSDSTVRAIVHRYLGRPAPIRQITSVTGYDEYWHAMRDGRGYSFDGNPRPLPVYRVDLADGGEPSPIYIRADRGDVVGRVDAGYRAFRWLGSGIHDLDFPVLFGRRPRLWNIAILAPVLIGIFASATGVWLGMSYAVRTLSATLESSSWRKKPNTSL